MKKIFFLVFVATCMFVSCKKDKAETTPPYQAEVIVNGKSHIFYNPKWIYDGDLYNAFYEDSVSRFEVYILNKSIGTVNFDNSNSVFISVENNNYGSVYSRGSITISMADTVIAGTFSGRFYINNDTTTVFAAGSFRALKTTMW